MDKKNISEIQEGLIDLLVTDYYKGNTSVALTKETNIVTEYMLNSVDALELLLKIEERFDIEIPDDDLNIDLLQNVEKLADFIYNL